MDKTALSSYVRTLARGPGRSRNLTQQEAFEAFSIILTGEAPKEAVGALLMLMRFRSENVDEITGAVKACHAHLPNWMQSIKPNLDWPSYAAGKSRKLPLFLLAALTLSQRGIKIFMHGYNSHQTSGVSTEAALKALNITVAQGQSDVEQSLKENNFAYLPLRNMSSVLFDLINLRDILGLRSPINTVLRGLNPTRADASLIGVFHPPYIPLQAGTVTKMQNGDALILKGGGGEAERTPYKPLKAMYCKNGEEQETIFKPIRDKSLMAQDKDREDQLSLKHFKAIWEGNIEDQAAEAMIIATIAIGLFCSKTVQTPNEADEMAKALWIARTS